MVETNDMSEPEPTGRSGEEPRFCGVLEDIKQAKGIKRKLDDQGDAAGADPKDCAATGDSATSSQLQETEGPRRVQKKQRLVWSADLHARFMQAVNTLGIERAVPKTILQIMNVDGMTRENVASHLQKYRLYLKKLAGVSAADEISPDALQRVHEEAVRQHVAKQQQEMLAQQREMQNQALKALNALQMPFFNSLNHMQMLQSGLLKSPTSPNPAQPSLQQLMMEAYNNPMLQNAAAAAALAAVAGNGQGNGLPGLAALSQAPPSMPVSMGMQASHQMLQFPPNLAGLGGGLPGMGNPAAAFGGAGLQGMAGGAGGMSHLAAAAAAAGVNSLAPGGGVNHMAALYNAEQMRLLSGMASQTFGGMPGDESQVSTQASLGFFGMQQPLC